MHEWCCFHSVKILHCLLQQECVLGKLETEGIWWWRRPGQQRQHHLCTRQRRGQKKKARFGPMNCTLKKNLTCNLLSQLVQQSWAGCVCFTPLSWSLHCIENIDSESSITLSKRKSINIQLFQLNMIQISNTKKLIWNDSHLSKTNHVSLNVIECHYIKFISTIL